MNMNNNIFKVTNYPNPNFVTTFQKPKPFDSSQQTVTVHPLLEHLLKWG